MIGILMESKIMSLESKSCSGERCGVKLEKGLGPDHMCDLA